MKCRNCGNKTRFRPYSSRARREQGLCLNCFHILKEEVDWDERGKWLSKLDNIGAIALTRNQEYDGLID